MPVIIYDFKAIGGALRKQRIEVGGLSRDAYALIESPHETSGRQDAGGFRTHFFMESERGAMEKAE